MYELDDRNSAIPVFAVWACHGGRREGLAIA